MSQNINAYIDTCVIIIITNSIHDIIFLSYL